MRRVKKIKHHSQKRTVLYTVLIIALVCCAGGIGYLWFTMHSDSSALVSELNTLKEDHSNYEKLVNDAQKPADWNDAVFDELKAKALAAYDTAEIDLYQKAVDGDREAQEQIRTQEGTAAAEPSEKVKDYTEILQNLNAYPENLVQLGMQDEGLLNFVAAYPSRKDQNLSETEVPTVTESLDQVPSLKAADPAWGYLPFDGSLFARTGAPETALSMVMSYLLEDPEMSPAFFALWAQEYGYESEPVKEDDSIFAGAAYTWGVNYTPLPGYETYVADSVNQGSLVIVELNNTNGPDGIDFVVVPSVDENGNWTVYDPLSSEPSKSVSPDSVKDNIVNVYAFWIG